jgi:hypothetical protein
MGNPQPEWGCLVPGPVQDQQQPRWIPFPRDFLVDYFISELSHRLSCGAWGIWEAEMKRMVN